MYESMLSFTVDRLLTPSQDFIIDIDNIEAHGTYLHTLSLGLRTLADSM